MLNKFLIILLLVITSNIALADCPVGPLTKEQAGRLPSIGALILSLRNRGVPMEKVADTFMLDDQCEILPHPEMSVTALYLLIQIYDGKFQSYTPGDLHRQLQQFVDATHLPEATQ